MVRTNSRTADLLDTNAPGVLPLDLVEQLKQAAAGIPPPKDYFVGLPVPSLMMPRNVLVFSRTRWQGISKTECHHRHVLVANGMTTGRVVVDGMTYRLDPGQVFLIHPHQCHQYRDLVETDMFWLFVTFDLDHGAVRPGLRGRVMNLPLPAWDLLIRMVKAYADPSTSETVRAGSTALLLAAVLLKMEALAGAPQVVASLPQKETSFVTRVSEYLVDHVTLSPSLRDIARALGMSPGHLRNRFREVTGVSLGTFRRGLQVRRARELIGTSDATFSEIAGACGFHSLTAFSRAFHRETGQAPRTYRELLRKEDPGCYLRVPSSDRHDCSECSPCRVLS